MPNYYYSGQGTLYVADRDVNGLPDGLVSVGNVPSLELSIETTKFEHKEAESGARSIDLTVIQELKGTFSMVLESISAENMAMAFFGTMTTETGAGVVDEPVTISKYDVRYITDNVNWDDGVSPSFVDAALAAMTEGTDYTVDYSTGAITVLSSGAIPASLPDTILIDYTFLDHYKTAAFTQTSVIKYMRFEGINTVDDLEVIVEVFKAELDPAQNFPLINDEIAQLTINGTILNDPLANARIGSGFFVERRTQVVV